MTETREHLPPTPPGWVNSLMRRMLRTPLLGRLFRKTALITVTGRRSGREITTPVSCVPDGEAFIVTAHRARTWWRNLPERPKVRLVHRGRRLRARARVLEGQEAEDSYARYVEALPSVAKASGIELVEGVADRAAVEELLSYTKVIAIEPR